MAWKQLNELQLKLLECSVCLETCTPPISMCVGTHVVCSECATVLTECATCRQPISAERSWFAEDLSSIIPIYPCKYVNNGCREKFYIDQLNAHLPNCTFKDYDCLIGGKFVNDVWKNVCEWKGPEFKLLDHIKQTHGEPFCIPNSKNRSIKNIPLFNGKTPTSIHLICAHNAHFWKLTYFCCPSKEIGFCIIFIGTEDKSSQFQYKCDFGEETGCKLSFYSHRVQCSLEESFKKTLKISESIRRVLNSPTGKLQYTITILKTE